jgi:hypothetical protein
MFLPLLGRFLSADTIVPSPGNPQAWNRYAYTFNNPLKYTDPSGHCPICIPVIIIAAVAISGWLIAAPPVYTPSVNEAENAARVAEAESRWQTQAGRWIDEHPVEYVAAITAGYYGVEGVIEGIDLLDQLSQPTPSEPEQLKQGNDFHYDTENGGPGQLDDMYPDTTFDYKRRGQKGVDATWTGGTHPSQYPDSTWDPANDFGDFKTDTRRSQREFYKEIRRGKLPPNTQPLPYDRDTGELKPDHKFGPF